jgi:hypothetical protein
MFRKFTHRLRRLAAAASVAATLKKWTRRAIYLRDTLAYTPMTRLIPMVRTHLNPPNELEAYPLSSRHDRLMPRLTT